MSRGDADPNTGYDDLSSTERQTVVGGTSAVAPLYAGLFAAFGTKLGFVTPKLWQNQGAFNDITVGGNGMYSARRVRTPAAESVRQSEPGSPRCSWPPQSLRRNFHLPI